VLRLLSQPLAHFDAVRRRHYYVEADKVGFELRDGTECRLAIDSLDDVVPLPLQELAKQRQSRRLVVDSEDQGTLVTHGSKFPTLSANVAKSTGLLR
jgi:hypothetical protein